jgi:hypothetical protein
VTTALQSSHPKTWMEDQRVLHYFISTVNNFMTVPIPIQQEIINDEEEKVADPLLNNYGEPENQTNILVQIAEAEEASLELEPSISNLELNEFKIENNLNDSNVEEVPNESVEEIITYTDPVGNTFETPVFKSEIEETETLDVEFTLSAEDDDFEDFQEGVHDYWLAVDPNVKSLQPTPEDHVQFEADLSKLEVEVEVDDFDLSSGIEDEEYGDVPDFF